MRPSALHTSTASVSSDISAASRLRSSSSVGPRDRDLGADLLARGVEGLGQLVDRGRQLARLARAARLQAVPGVRGGDQLDLARVAARRVDVVLEEDRDEERQPEQEQHRAEHRERRLAAQDTVQHRALVSAEVRADRNPEEHERRERVEEERRDGGHELEPGAHRPPSSSSATRVTSSAVENGFVT